MVAVVAENFASLGLATDPNALLNGSHQVSMPVETTTLPNNSLYRIIVESVNQTSHYTILIVLTSTSNYAVILDTLPISNNGKEVSLS